MRIRENLNPKYGEVWGRQLDGQEEEQRGHLGQLWTKLKVGSSYRGQLLAVIAVPCSPHLRAWKTSVEPQAPCCRCQIVAPESPGIQTLKCGIYITLDDTEGALVILFLPDNCKLTQCHNKWNKMGEFRSSLSGQLGGPKERGPALNR